MLQTKNGERIIPNDKKNLQTLGMKEIKKQYLNTEKLDELTSARKFSKENLNTEKTIEKLF